MNDTESGGAAGALGRDHEQGSGERGGGRASRGFATVLIIVYAVFALSATARSLVQIAGRFEQAPLAYVLSLLAALTYIAVTVALIRRGSGSPTVLWLVLLELVGVVTVGTLSIAAPGLFPDATVWSGFGIGYGFVPLALPLIAVLYLLRERRRRTGRR